MASKRICINDISQTRNTAQNDNNNLDLESQNSPCTNKHIGTKEPNPKRIKISTNFQQLTIDKFTKPQNETKFPKQYYNLLNFFSAPNHKDSPIITTNNANLGSKTQNIPKQSTHRCNNNKQCILCPFIYTNNHIISKQTQIKYKLQPNNSCVTKNCVYIIICTKCNHQYIGETKNTLRERFRDHLQSLRHNITYNHPVTTHFNSIDHDYKIHLKVAVIHRTTDINRKKLEMFYISNIMTDEPYGINRQHLLNWKYWENNTPIT